VLSDIQRRGDVEGRVRAHLLLCCDVLEFDRGECGMPPEPSRGRRHIIRPSILLGACFEESCSQLRPHRVFLMSDFEVFTAVTMKNVVFWDIETQFVLHRGHITSPLQCPVG
jgi:hypothetical protein